MTDIRVPRTRVHLVHQQLRDQILQAMEPILFGPHELDNVSLQPLEQAFAQLTQHTYAIGVNSATSGLFLALTACGVGSGDEVITVGNSDISTTAAISHCGAKPVLCDVLASDFTMDPGQIEQLITNKTKAILPVDLYGHPADVRLIRKIAEKNQLKVVEDAALATGASDHGQPVGSFADATVFSFGAHKPLGSVGNGGMVITNDPVVAKELALLRSYGRLPQHERLLQDTPLGMIHTTEGYNLPLDPLEAAIIAAKLPYLQQWTTARRKVAALYAEGLRDTPALRLPHLRSESEATFYCYTVRVMVGNRDRIYRELNAKGIDAALYYAPPVYQQPAYQEKRLNSQDVPVTTQVSSELLCLPVHPDMTEIEITQVVDSLKQLL